jgi:prevent-host-death family protein
MQEIGVRELGAKINEVVRRVRENKETFEVTYRGRTVAQIIPMERPRELTEEEEDRLWEEIDELAESIGKRWPKGVSAVDAVREQRH